MAGGNWRNLSVAMLVLLLLAGNIASTRGTFRHRGAGIRIGIAVVVLLISLIGGRIIPSFTRNWLVRENPGRLPVSFGRFDIIAVGFGALALVGWISSPADSRRGGAGARGAAPSRSSRTLGRRSYARERLLVILHVGYLFVPLGFLLNALAVGLVSAGAGTHAWMAGAAGIMTLAVITRATLGHTGRRLTASVSTQAIYAAIIVGAVARICAVIHPAHSDRCCMLPLSPGRRRSLVSQSVSAGYSPAETDECIKISDPTRRLPAR